MDNSRAAGLMLLAMAFFAVEDMFVKFLSTRLSVGQILAVSGAMGCVTFWLLLRRAGGRLITRDLAHPLVITRTLAEVVGTLGFVTAVATTALSSAAAIIQALPLVIVVLAALVLGESIGWRRWLAVAAGLVGVMMIIKPGLAGFDVNSLWAVLSVIGLAVRDVVTRRVPRRIASDQMSTLAWGALVPAGLVVAWGFGTPLQAMSALDMGLFLGLIGFGVTGYAALVSATRIGDAAVIAPFRYSRLIFALIIAVLVFGERPDLWTLAGATIIAAAGGFAMWREVRAGRRARALGAAR
ncbi:DMT family transporter [Paracoccus sp. p4-l81]|uniref:DMT family transporter n=1 Tax=unclassified Paracoccus (in: a-proteobacteria) TaxID=2688777 RepID=UPI0035B722DC